MSRLARAYEPRRPTETVLYRIVREHLETFLAQTRETYERPLPRYVEAELRAYLRCGVFAHGFSRFRCDGCGHDLLVAFSCKTRGVCPSCSGRRMSNCAAHLVDRVVPDVPLRQFVLSLPHELRRLAAFKQDVLGAVVRTFTDAVAASYRARAKRDGIEGSCEGGAVTFLQRFGGSLNLNLHLHVAFLDGVFTRDAEQRVQFHAARAVDAAELQGIVQRVYTRVTSWLRRHGYIDDKPLEGRSNEAPEQGALEACAEVAMQRGAFAQLDAKDAFAPDDTTRTSKDEPAKLRFAADYKGFNVHAGVHIAAGDDMGRERLFRYGARPALALDRLRHLPGGRVAYRVKYAAVGRAKHRVMTPLELLARIAAILPPPRFPLIRFHGVLAPRSSWRRAVVPQPREAKTCTPPKAPKPNAASGKSPAGGGAQTSDRRAPPPRRNDGGGAKAEAAGAHPAVARPTAAVASAPSRAATIAVLGALAPRLLSPSILAVAHWDRLLGGLLYAASPRLPWSQLLRRTFAEDVEQCPTCHGRLRLLASITEPKATIAILARLGLSYETPPLATARDPTDDEARDDDT